MSGKKNEHTIGVNVFKELINEMKNDLMTKMDDNTKDINKKLESQDNKIADLSNQVKIIPTLVERISALQRNKFLRATI